LLGNCQRFGTDGLGSAHSQAAQTGRQAEAVKKTLDDIKLPPGFKISLYALVPAAGAIAVGSQGKVIFVEPMETDIYAVNGLTRQASQRSRNLLTRFEKKISARRLLLQTRRAFRHRTKPGFVLCGGGRKLPRPKGSLIVSDDYMDAF